MTVVNCIIESLPQDNQHTKVTTSIVKQLTANINM